MMAITVHGMRPGGECSFGSSPLRTTTHVVHFDTVDTSNVIGIDIGGTKCAVALYERRTWKLLKREKFSTRAERGFPAVLEETLALAKGWISKDVVAVGVGVPGLVRHQGGVILRLPNIPGGEGFPLLEKVRETFNLSASVENDSNCFTLAEAREGAGKGSSVVCGVTMGTGVGGGMVVDGRIFRGADGFASEFGHMLLRPGSPPSGTSDQRGEVEQFLSGTALRKRCPAAKRSEDLLEGPLCASLHESIVLEVSWLCANLTHCVNPSVIVFGGSTGKALRSHLPSIEKEMTRWMMKDTPLPRLAISSISGAATMGAAMLAADTLTT